MYASLQQQAAACSVVRTNYNKKTKLIQSSHTERFMAEESCFRWTKAAPRNKTRKIKGTGEEEAIPSESCRIVAENGLSLQYE